MSRAIDALAGALTDDDACDPLVAEASCGSRRSAPRRPWGLERGWWSRISRENRRKRYRCCWLPLAVFALEDCKRGRGESWWLDKGDSK